MIRKLKLKFVILAMTAICILLAIIVAGMNLINYNAVISEADETLSLLSQNRGSFPDLLNDFRKPLPDHMSPEVPYESRYFSVLLNSDGEAIAAEMSQIASVDVYTAVEYAETVLESDRVKGFLGEFRYLQSSESNGTRIIFLDCGRKLDSFRTFLNISLLMAAVGVAAAFLIIFPVVGKIVRPIAESYEKQKRFITDAGHEIKTPLTIINANVDVLEMELGDGNECLEDIQLQTKRLTSLTNDLVLLARMEESENTLQKIDFPLSEVIADTVLPFRTPAQAQGKEFLCEIQPNITMNGNDKSIRQLLSLLLDNALKYSPSGGTVSVSMVQHSKTAVLTVFNTTAMEIPRESLEHVFDRFYRTDSSRNSETGGHGIGLSVAQAIVNAHDGKIQASTDDGKSFRITVILPL